ncbi:cell wall glycosyl hydrolase YteR [Diaporthe helianthi]|uniref:Cell wall glycosyl hydrolase YteR n=1 Tax=Diaporthe helianthi TaxID=158607 RepID=A0A2P5I2V0_DIAHE|nr:cell wall glycosyl hydrolase YteR [Diaporthe helianthi]
MRSSILLASGAAAAAVAVDLKLASRAINTSTGSYLARMADTHIRRGIKLDFGYTNAVIYQGLEFAYELTKNESIADAYEKQMSIINKDGTIKEYEYDFYSLDEYRFGMNTLWWYERTGEEKYKLAADGIRGMLDRHPRTPSGGFWHRAPIYENQMWLDGIFMADSFYAKYTSLYDNDNTTAWDDITLQFDNIDKYTRNKKTNLLVHGYDESKKAIWADPVTGASPLVWSRAVGWWMVSLLETIPLIPESHPGKEKLTGYFQAVAEGVLKAQDAATSGWWLVMDFPGRKKNYIESSASAMFTYSLLKGVRLGLIDAKTYLEPAKKAYQALVDDYVVEKKDGTLDWEGTVLVGSLNSNASFEYYTSIALSPNDYKGVGPFMYASYEFELI